MNFHSKNCSLLSGKPDPAKAHPTPQDLRAVMATAEQRSISQLFDVCCWEKKTTPTPQKTKPKHTRKPEPNTDSLISCPDTKSFHCILLLPLLFHQVQDSGVGDADALPVASPLWSPVSPPSHLHSRQPSCFLAHTWHQHPRPSLLKPTTRRMQGHCLKPPHETTAGGLSYK